MAKFFTTPKDLARWVKDNNSSPEEATNKILLAIGNNKHEQDVFETTKRILANKNHSNESVVLFDLLSQYDIVEKNIKEAEAKVNDAIVSDPLFQYGVITAEEKNKLVKKAQIMRQPGEYPMPLKVCPKLPFSVGKRLISTYNCRHYCLDSLVFDDDPDRVYCAEALWRKHVMDKFSHDWQDPKTGQLVGGYINNRFFVFPDAGTPANQNVPRTHGNPMELKPGERTRQPRPHQWPIERRLQEQRSPNSTEALTLYNVVANSSNKIILTANTSEISEKKSKNNVGEIFSKAIDLHNSGMKEEDSAIELSQQYSLPIEKVVIIQTAAINKMQKHQADSYVVAQNFNRATNMKIIPNNVPARIQYSQNGQIITPTPLTMQTGYIEMGTPVVSVNEKYPSLVNIDNKENNVFEVYSTKDNSLVGIACVEKQHIPSPDQLPSVEEMTERAKETGLVEEGIKENPQGQPLQESVQTQADQAGQAEAKQTEQK